jgi:hypothetical protein
MVSMVFGVLFGFRRSDFRSSDYLPKFGRKQTSSTKGVKSTIYSIEFECF